MNLRRSLAAKVAVSVTAASLALAPTATALAQEESPSPAPEATTTDAEATTTAEDDGHASGPNTPKDNTFALGQSMQIRVNADAEPNSAAIDFRWSVSQLTVQGPPDGSKDGDYTVPVPEGGDIPRYLNKFGFISVENGEAQWDVSVEDGWSNARSVSLFPQDAEPAVSLKAEFTLDGEPVKAQDIVGKSGVVTATYTLINNTTSPTTVTVEDLSGNPVEVTVDADTPLVGIAKTLLPYRFTGLNTGTGIQGADGRGNNQVQWIALPFAPLAKDHQASFGWSAHVHDGYIPSMIIQVAVLHIPAHEDDPATPEDESATNGSDSPVNLDPAVAEIQSGLAQVVAGIETLTAGGGEDPLKALEANLNAFFQSLGTDLQTVATNLDPAVPGTLANQLQSLIAPLTEIEAALGAASGNWDALLETLADVVALLENRLTGCDGLAGTQFPGGVEQCKSVLAVLKGIVDNPDSVKTNIDFIRGALAPIIPLLTSVVDAMAGLSETFSTIAEGLPVAELPTLDSVISSVVASVLSSPGGQQITGGLAQVKGGVGLATSEIAAFAGEAIAALQGGVATANEAIVGLKSSLAGMLAKSAESPLIYGPLPEGTPEGTVLAGAYEFRVDAADNNLPNTLPRILIGLLALIAGGLAVRFLGNRAAA